MKHNTLLYILFLTLFSAGAVALSIPTKTLNDPSTLPSLTFTVGADKTQDDIDFAHGETFVILLFESMCDGVLETLSFLGANQSVRGLYKIVFSGATIGTLLGERSDPTITIAQSGTTTVTLTPRVKQLSESFSNIDTNTNCDRTEALSYDFSEVYLEARIAVHDIRKQATGSTGPPIVYTATEINQVQGQVLGFTKTGDSEEETFSVPENATAQQFADSIQVVFARRYVYSYGEVQTDGSLKVYGSEGFTIEASSTTASVEDIFLCNALLLYPNPAKHSVHLQYGHPTAVRYTLYGLNGQQLGQYAKQGAEHVLDVAHLAKGIFLLQAREGGDTKHYRFVKE